MFSNKIRRQFLSNLSVKSAVKQNIRISVNCFLYKSVIFVIWFARRILRIVKCKNRKYGFCFYYFVIGYIWLSPATETTRRRGSGIRESTKRRTGKPFDLWKLETVKHSSVKLVSTPIFVCAFPLIISYFYKNFSKWFIAVPLQFAGFFFSFFFLSFLDGTHF